MQGPTPKTLQRENSEPAACVWPCTNTARSDDDFCECEARAIGLVQALLKLNINFNYVLFSFHDDICQDLFFTLDPLTKIYGRLYDIA